VLIIDTYFQTCSAPEQTQTQIVHSAGDIVMNVTATETVMTIRYVVRQGASAVASANQVS
jgi:hypothetical protein